MSAVCEPHYEASTTFYTEDFEGTDGASVDDPYCGRYSAYNMG